MSPSNQTWAWQQVLLPTETSCQPGTLGFHPSLPTVWQSFYVRIEIMGKLAPELTQLLKYSLPSLTCSGEHHLIWGLSYHVIWLLGCAATYYGVTILGCSLPCLELVKSRTVSKISLTLPRQERASQGILCISWDTPIAMSRESSHDLISLS